MRERVKNVGFVVFSAVVIPPLFTAAVVYEYVQSRSRSARLRDQLVSYALEQERQRREES